MRVPAEEDWGNWQADLDQAYAHNIFAGRTLEEVMPLFEQNVIERTDELRFMPPVPFRYYMIGFRDYVMSKRVFNTDHDASDAASCFLDLVLERLENARETIIPIMPDLMASVEYVACNQAKFDASVDVYGSFPEKLAKVRALYKNA